MNAVEGEVVRAVEDKTELCRLMLAFWGSHEMMIGLNSYDVAKIDALGLFSAQGETLALASWTIRDETAYLCALHSLKPGDGHATRLLDALRLAAKARGAVRLRAMLTNDNMPGMAFYQRRGFRFCGLYVDAIDAYRSVIPTIIATGYLGIAIHDALELEIEL